MPGVPVGTRTRLWRRPTGASGSVTPMTIATAQSGRRAEVDHHFRPLSTHSSPSSLISSRTLLASELATAGSVMEKIDRISPSSRGSSQRCCCSAVPNRERISIFPVSGDEQLSASGAINGLHPVISASGAYSKFVKPAPRESAGNARFHSPGAGPPP